MVKTPSSFVLASLKGSTYRIEYASPFRSLRPCRRDVLTILQSI
jgi:hypothetical protein